DDVLVGVERDGGGVGAQFDVVVGVEVLVVEIDLWAGRGAAQVVLGQRRTFVGPFGFLADEHDAAVETFSAERLGGIGAGQAGTDDDEGVGFGHGYLLAAARRRSRSVRHVDTGGRPERGGQPGEGQ